MPHTKEPWSLDKYSNISASNEPLRVSGVYLPTGNSDRSGEATSNARRIVACVNACAGISNEELELKDVKPVKAASDYIEQLEQQNAELIEALGELSTLSCLDRVAVRIISDAKEKAGVV